MPVAVFPENSSKWIVGIAHLELAEQCVDGNWTKLDLNNEFNKRLFDITSQTGGYGLLKMKYSQSESGSKSGTSQHVNHRYFYFENIWNNRGERVDSEKLFRIHYNDVVLLIQTQIDGKLSKKHNLTQEEVECGTRLKKHGRKTPKFKNILKGKKVKFYSTIFINHIQ